MAKYSAIFLCKKSRTRLIEFALSRVLKPDGWKLFANHMTICMGNLPHHPYLWHMESSNPPIPVIIDAFGWTDGVFAARVSNRKRLDDRQPHITIFVDVKNGFKPKDANNITEWHLIAPQTLNLLGTIKQL